MITCVVDYIIDAKKIAEFETFARRWMELVEKHGGQHHGYFLPSEGASDRALALFSFPSLAAYEQYRMMFGREPSFIEADRIRDESGCVIRYDRTFMRPLSETPPNRARQGLAAGGGGAGVLAGARGVCPSSDLSLSREATFSREGRSERIGRLLPLGRKRKREGVWCRKRRWTSRLSSRAGPAARAARSGPTTSCSSAELCDVIGVAAAEPGRRRTPSATTMCSSGRCGRAQAPTALTPKRIDLYKRGPSSWRPNSRAGRRDERRQRASRPSLARPPEQTGRRAARRAGTC